MDFVMDPIESLSHKSRIAYVRHMIWRAAESAPKSEESPIGLKIYSLSTPRL